MEVEIFVPCKAAIKNPNGTLTIRQAYRFVLAHDFPVTLDRIAIAVQIRFEKDRRVQPYTIIFCDSTGRCRSATIPSALEVESDPDPDGQYIWARDVHKQSSLKFDQPGEYRFQLMVGKKIAATYVVVAALHSPLKLMTP